MPSILSGLDRCTALNHDWAQAKYSSSRHYKDTNPQWVGIGVKNRALRSSIFFRQLKAGQFTLRGL